MQFIKLSFLTLFFLITTSISAQDVEWAIKYNDKIVEMNGKALNALEVLIDSYENYIPEEMDSLHARAVCVVDSVLRKIKRLAPFEGDSTFKCGAVKLFETYKILLEGEHRWIIELLKLPEEKYGDEQIQSYERYITECNAQCDKAINELMIVQKSFAKKFKFEVVSE
jgi:hypothetical protein